MWQKSTRQGPLWADHKVSRQSSVSSVSIDTIISHYLQFDILFAPTPCLALMGLHITLDRSRHCMHFRAQGVVYLASVHAEVAK